MIGIISPYYPYNPPKSFRVVGGGWIPHHDPKAEQHLLN